MNNRTNPTPVILALLLSFMCIAYGQRAAGLYAHADFRNTPDAKAKVAEFTSASKSTNGYIVRVMSGRQIKVDPGKFRGAVYYPSTRRGATVEQHKKKLKELRAYQMKFPASSRYLVNKITKLSGDIYRLENPTAPSTIKRDGVPLGTLVLKSGREYEGVRMKKKQPDGIKITHQGGAATIPYEELPASLCKKLGGFDPDVVKEYRKTDRERWQEQEAKLRKEMAGNEHSKAKADASKKRSLETRRHNLVRPVEPVHGQIDSIRGRILNVLNDGILISIGRAGVCKVEMDSSAFVDDEIVSDIVERTKRRFKYTAVSGAMKTVPVYVPVSKGYKNYLARKGKYQEDELAIEKELADLIRVSARRDEERESLLRKKKQEFMKLRAKLKISK